jgi:hypothetical protein
VISRMSAVTVSDGAVFTIGDGWIARVNVPRIRRGSG